jgi:Ca2+-binding RTX toxin-like protein
LSGGIGNDQLYVGSEDTFIDGGDGFDAVWRQAGDDTVTSNDDSDTLVGRLGVDRPREGRSLRQQRRRRTRSCTERRPPPAG